MDEGIILKNVTFGLIDDVVINFVSFVDVISIERTGENFRLIFDVKGRFAVHEITPEEAKVFYLNTSSIIIYHLDTCINVLIP